MHVDGGAGTGGGGGGGMGGRLRVDSSLDASTSAHPRVRSSVSSVGSSLGAGHSHLGMSASLASQGHLDSSSDSSEAEEECVVQRKRRY